MDLKEYIKGKIKEEDSDAQNKGFQSQKKGHESKIIELYQDKIKLLTKIKRSVWISIAVLLLAIGVLAGIRFHVYRGYQVLSSAENEDTQSAGYTQLGDCLLKYGDDGAYLLSQSQKIVWNQTYEMSNPASDVRGEYAVIYDRKGTSMYVLKKDKPVGPIETKFPILQAEVTEKGSVAAILEDGEKTWINYYVADGSVIAENQTRMENPGYPLDITVSPDGDIIMVSYLYIEEGQISSRIVFYSFGVEGQNKVDNIIADYTYENTMIPQVIYVNEQTAVAFRDDGYTIFDSNGTVEKKKEETLQEEIISTFYDDKYFGLILKGTEEDKPYVLQLFDPSGRKKFSKAFDKGYQDISISGDMIIMCNSDDVMMYNLKGILKFDGTMEEGAVKNIFQVASKRYMVVSESGINTIKLK